MKRLSSESHWDGTYEKRDGWRPLQTDGTRNYCNRLILGKLAAVGLDGKRILEVGAGDSAWLPFIAKKFSSSTCIGVDYSKRGCELLRDRARLEGAKLEVYCEDMFVERSDLHGAFDVVMSFGVVEHFSDLAMTLVALRRFLRRNGTLFTVIPNMAGVLGSLTRRWNREVYELHNPHDWTSFEESHRRAGLDVVSGGYLGTLNFGVLSACFPKRIQSPSLYMYRALLAMSWAVWFVEGRVGRLPETRYMSPYIYAISKSSG